MVQLVRTALQRIVGRLLYVSEGKGEQLLDLMRDDFEKWRD